MTTADNKTQAINSIVSTTSSVLGAIHAVATAVADLSIKAELSINAKYTTKEDGNKLTHQDLIKIAENRIKKSQNFQFKIGIRKETINDLEVE